MPRVAFEASVRPSSQGLSQSPRAFPDSQPSPFAALLEGADDASAAAAAHDRRSPDSVAPSAARSDRDVSSGKATPRSSQEPASTDRSEGPDPQQAVTPDDAKGGKAADAETDATPDIGAGDREAASIETSGTALLFLSLDVTTGSSPLAGEPLATPAATVAPGVPVADLAIAAATPPAPDALSDGPGRSVPSGATTPDAALSAPPAGAAPSADVPSGDTTRPQAMTGPSDSDGPQNIKVAAPAARAGTESAPAAPMAASARLAPAAAEPAGVETAAAGSATPEVHAADAAMAETAIGEPIPAETLPAETVPAKTVPAETASAEAVPAKTGASKTAAAETAVADPAVAEPDGAEHRQAGGDHGHPERNGEPSHRDAARGRDAFPQATDGLSSQAPNATNPGDAAGKPPSLGDPPQPFDRSLTPVVAQAAAPAAAAPGLTAATTATPIEGLAVEIAARAQLGRNRFEIRLDPPELGRIDVRLDVDRGGHVTSRIIVDRAETLDLLRRDAPELERALQQAGLKTSDNGLQFTLRDHAFGGRDHDRAPPAAAWAIVPDADLEPGETVPGSYGRLLRPGGSIDIRV